MPANSAEAFTGDGSSSQQAIWPTGSNEVHLGSWMHAKNYRDIAEPLVAHVTEPGSGPRAWGGETSQIANPSDLTIWSMLFLRCKTRISFNLVQLPCFIASFPFWNPYSHIPLPMSFSLEVRESCRAGRSILLLGLVAMLVNEAVMFCRLWTCLNRQAWCECPQHIVQNTLRTLKFSHGG